MVFSELQDVRVSERVGASTAIMIGSAAVVALSGGSMLGPFIVGASSAADASEIRNRRWHIVLLNAAVGSLTILVAAYSYRFLVDRTGTQLPLALLAAVGMTIAYASAYMLALSAGLHLTGRTKFRDVMRSVLPSCVQQIPFALLGYFLGRLYLTLGAPVLLLIVVPILIAR